MIRNQHSRVDLLPCNWVKATLNAKVLLNHLFLVGVAAPDNDWLLHQVIADWALQIVRYLERSLITIVI